MVSWSEDTDKEGDVLCGSHTAWTHTCDTEIHMKIERNSVGGTVFVGGPLLTCRVISMNVTHENAVPRRKWILFKIILLICVIGIHINNYCNCRDVFFGEFIYDFYQNFINNIFIIFFNINILLINRLTCNFRTQVSVLFMVQLHVRWDAFMVFVY